MNINLGIPFFRQPALPAYVDAIQQSTIHFAFLFYMKKQQKSQQFDIGNNQEIA